MHTVGLSIVLPYNLSMFSRNIILDKSVMQIWTNTKLAVISIRTAGWRGSCNVMGRPRMVKYLSFHFGQSSVDLCCCCYFGRVVHALLYLSCEVHCRWNKWGIHFRPFLTTSDLRVIFLSDLAQFWLYMRSPNKLTSETKEFLLTPKVHLHCNAARYLVFNHWLTHPKYILSYWVANDKVKKQ